MVGRGIRSWLRGELLLKSLMRCLLITCLGTQGYFTNGFFTCFVYTTLGLYLVFSVGDRDASAFDEIKCYVPEGGRWVSDDYNLYFWLKNRTVVSPVNPNGSFYSSIRDKLGRFKRATKAVNRSLEMVKYSLALVLWDKRLIPEFIT